MYPQKKSLREAPVMSAILAGIGIGLVVLVVSVCAITAYILWSAFLLRRQR